MARLQTGLAPLHSISQSLPSYGRIAPTSLFELRPGSSLSIEPILLFHLIILAIAHFDVTPLYPSTIQGVANQHLAPN